MNLHRGQKVENMNHMETMIRKLRTTLLAAALAGSAGLALAHGDVTPQAVDVSTLKALGSDWLVENPYRGDKEAIRVGDSAFNQNCARCHGLGAISGGIAPDLRFLEHTADADEYFIGRVRNGVSRNGAVYMPPFEGTLQQEAMWAIRAWLGTVYEK
jgi:cytochrome c-550 PedF